MIHAEIKDSLESWRNAARKFLAGGVPPEMLAWSTEEQPALFSSAPSLHPSVEEINVPKQFLDLARTVACFDDPRKWSLLYRILYRLRNENRHLLNIETDRDVRQAMEMQKAVSRDIHKFHAFVRFRRVEADGKEIYVAWHEPQHSTVERATPFFARRFGTMHFSILTPKGCAHWDTKELKFSAAATRDMAPREDETEEFWLLYYRSIFNPFRLKVNAMKKELPVRHWATLPEAVLIPELIRKARSV
jgi:DNA polymerase